MSTRIIIDGYNVIRRTPALANAERRSLHSGREALILQLAARYGGNAASITLVFDGAGATEARETRYNMTIIYTPHGTIADDRITSLAREETSRGNMVIVATDDQAIRKAMEALAPRAKHVSAASLGDQLQAPPKLLAKQYRHRAAVKAQFTRDPDNETPRRKKK